MRVIVVVGLIGLCVALPSGTAQGATPVDRADSSMSSMGKRAQQAARALGIVPGARTPLRAAQVAAPGGGAGGEAADQDDDDLPGGSQGELAIAVDDSGQHVVVGFNDARGFFLPQISVSGYLYSDDGGKTFVDGGQLPTGTSSIPGLPQVFGDPDVKYLGACNFIYTSILVAPFGGITAVQTMGFHRSFDCGHTWEGPFEISSATNPNGITFDGEPLDAADKEFIDVDRSTGRVLMSWSNFSLAVEISTTYSDNVLDPVPVWSPRVIVGAQPDDGQSSIPRFGPPGSNLVYVAWRTFPLTGGAGIRVARSTDHGATFSPAIDLSPPFFPPDQVLGNDRINWSPGMAVDTSHGHHRGTIYVTYGNNSSQDGADVVVQRSTDKGLSFSAPLPLNSRPGNDRSQWFPWITTDGRTGRALVFYYDQGVADSGDLSQTTFTFSDDGGKKWAQPRRLSSKPFQAGWGNDTGQPNLGDYNQAVVDNSGRYIAAYAFTHPVGFRDNQPAPIFSIPEPEVMIVKRNDQAAITSVDFRGAKATELRHASNGNGYLDDGETALVSFSIRNYVTNPLNARAINGALALVSSKTPGVQIPFGLTFFNRIDPGETETSTLPVLLRLSSGFVNGTDIELTLEVVSSNGLPTTLFATLHTGTPQPTVLLAESFDGVAPGALPAGWLSAHGAGANIVPWTTRNTFCGTGSNGAFHINANDGPPGVRPSRWERLFSPPFVVPADTGWVELEFDVCYDTEDDPAFNVLAYDGFFLRVTDATPGGVLRSVLAEAFARDFVTDGFAHYPKHFPRSNDPFYFEDMSAWAGDSGGVQHVKMRLPGMAGATAQLRFEFTQDGFATCSDVRPGHSCGVFIDNLVLRAVKAAP